jgi:hypothetical protein
MGLLEGTTAYLSGPIEAATDATSWRNSVKSDLRSLGIRPWDSLEKADWMLDYALADGAQQATWKSKIINDAQEDVSALEERGNIYFGNRQIRQVGLRLAQAADFIICRMTGEFTAGTFEELALAAGKPVLFWCDQKIPSMWLFDQFADLNKWRDTFFTSWADLYGYLGMVDNKEVSIDPLKWIFLTWEKR